MTCDRCGAEILIGSYPFCPHGSVRGGVVDDELPGGARWIENLGHEPVWVETKTQLRRELAARGLQPMVRHVDGDRHVGAWTTMDAVTLENARILTSRGARVEEAPDVEQYPVIDAYVRAGETVRVRVVRE